MKQVHCDGCGFTEDISMVRKTIKPVTLSIVTDPREWANGTKVHEADLCPTCETTLLHEYFRIPAKGKLELPAFMGPMRRAS